MTPILWRLTILATIFISGFGGGVAVTRNHYRPLIADMKEKTAAERQAAAEAVTKAVTANDVLKTKLGSDHAKNKAAIDDLFRGISGMHVTLPTAPSCEAVAPSGSASSVTRDGLLFEAHQRALDEATAGMAADAKYADEIVAGCRVMKLYLLAQ